MALGDREYRAVLDVVGEVHDAGSVAEMRALVLPALRHMVAAEYASYNEVGPDHALIGIADPELPDWAYEAWERHWTQNPLVQRHASTRDSRPYQWTDVVEPKEFRRTQLFAELYRPLGIDHQISFVLPSPANLTIGLALSRGGGRFSEPEREMLDLARPHLIQAYRNAQVKDALSALLDDVRRGVDATGQGVVVVAANGLVSFASARAAALVARSSAGELREGEAVPPGLIEAEHTSMLQLEGRDALLVRCVGGLEAGSKVLLLEPARQSLAPDLLEGLGLTPREAEVLAWLARGAETPEVASQLGISTRTVQKHAQAIYSKLGVRSRAQAVATAWAATEAAAAFV